MPLNEQQRRDRRSGIGGSDAAAVCGRHPAKTPMHVWLSKVHGLEQKETDYIRWGAQLESAIATIAAAELDLPLTVPDTMFRHPKHPELVANLDGVLDRREILETKCINPWSARDELGAEGTDGVVRWHLYQVQHYMMVTGLRAARVAYLVGGTSLKLYRIEADDEFHALLADLETAWWQKHVVGKEPPEESNVDALEQYLAHLHPKDDGTALRIEEGTLAYEAVRELREALIAEKAATERRAEKQVAVQRLMGDAAALDTPFGRITWKANKAGTRVFLPNRITKETAS